MLHYILEPTEQLCLFTQCHNLSLPCGTTLVHHFMFGLIKNGVGETMTRLSSKTMIGQNEILR